MKGSYRPRRRNNTQNLVILVFAVVKRKWNCLSRVGRVRGAVMQCAGMMSMSFVSSDVSLLPGTQWCRWDAVTASHRWRWWCSCCSPRLDHSSTSKIRGRSPVNHVHIWLYYWNRALCSVHCAFLLFNVTRRATTGRSSHMLQAVIVEYIAVSSK